MGAVLTVTSNPTRTSLVKRGQYVLDQILGTPPPPPPPDIPPLEQAGVAEGASLREQLAAHVADPNCAVCHRRLDPLGFAMENFDAIGRWRDQEAGQPIDASGELLLPDLSGLTARQAMSALAAVGVAPQLNGAGFVIRQQPAAGTPISGIDGRAELWLTAERGLL